MKCLTNIPLTVLATSYLLFTLPIYADQLNDTPPPNILPNAGPNTQLMPHNPSNQSPVTDEETKKIQMITRQYLLQNPEIILEALQILQRKQFEQTEQTIKQTQQLAIQRVNFLFHDQDDLVMGNPHGKITLVEFFDYQCGHCINMAAEIDATIKNNADLRVILKESPMQGTNSNLAARAVLAANKQGKYLVFHQALLAAKQPLTKELIWNIASQIGLNTHQLHKDMHSREIEDQIQKTLKLAQDLKLLGTPAFFVGKTDYDKTSSSIQSNQSNTHIIYIPGQIPLNQLQNLLNKFK